MALCKEAHEQQPCASMSTHPVPHRTLVTASRLDQLPKRRLLILIRLHGQQRRRALHKFARAHQSSRVTCHAKAVNELRVICDGVKAGPMSIDGARQWTCVVGAPSKEPTLMRSITSRCRSPAPMPSSTPSACCSSCCGSG